MHTITVPAPIAAGAPARRAAVAGGIYVGAWLVGLGVHPSGPDLLAAPVEVAQHYARHGTSAALSSLLVHGVAAGALASVVGAVDRRQRTDSPARRTYRRAGLGAAAVSVGQMVVGLVLALAPSAGSADALFDTLNRLDGLKLLLLAVAAGAAFRLDLSQWIRRVGVALAGMLVVAGIGFVALSPPLALVAAPALLLLLVWVAGSGVAAGR